MTRRRLLLMLALPAALAAIPGPTSWGQVAGDVGAASPGRDPAGSDPCLAPEDLVVVERVRARLRELDQREEMLVVREQAIDARHATVVEETRRLEELRAVVEEMLRRRDEARDEGLDALVKMVDQMKPADAAPMLTRMDRETAAALLERLGSRQAGKVLGAMSPDEAADLASLLAADSEVLRGLEVGS